MQLTINGSPLHGMPSERQIRKHLTEANEHYTDMLKRKIIGVDLAKDPDHTIRYTFNPRPTI